MVEEEEEENNEAENTGRSFFPITVNLWPKEEAGGVASLGNAAAAVVLVQPGGGELAVKQELPVNKNVIDSIETLNQRIAETELELEELREHVEDAAEEHLNEPKYDAEKHGKLEVFPDMHMGHLPPVEDIEKGSHRGARAFRKEIRRRKQSGHWTDEDTDRYMQGILEAFELDSAFEGHPLHPDHAKHVDEWVAEHHGHHRQKGEMMEEAARKKAERRAHRKRQVQMRKKMSAGDYRRSGSDSIEMVETEGFSDEPFSSEGEDGSSV